MAAAKTDANFFADKSTHSCNLTESQTEFIDTQVQGILDLQFTIDSSLGSELSMAVCQF